MRQAQQDHVKAHSTATGRIDGKDQRKDRIDLDIKTRAEIRRKTLLTRQPPVDAIKAQRNGSNTKCRPIRNDPGQHRDAKNTDDN